MTTAPTNEILASENAALAADLENIQTELDVAELRIKELESRLAASPSARDVREALDELLRCANAIVGADPRDPESAEAFTMFDQARVKARRCLALSNLDAAAPAAGGDAGPPYNFDRYINGTLMADGVCIEKQSTLDAAMQAAARLAAKGPNRETPVLVYRPLQAPSHSDAALVKACRNILPYLRWTIGPESPGHHPTMPSAVGAFEHAVATVTAPAAITPAVSEADVGRIVEEHLDSHTFEKNDDGSIVIDRAGMILTMSEDKRLIQSAAQGGGTEGGEV